MENRYTDLISSEATPEQAEAIRRRIDAGLMGPICSRQYITDAVNDDHRNGRFKWLSKLSNWLRQDCD